MHDSLINPESEAPEGSLVAYTFKTEIRSTLVPVFCIQVIYLRIAIHKGGYNISG